MFPRHLRITEAKEILTVLRRGDRLRSGLITAYHLPAADSRATVIIDKKVSKKAVVRNRLKRQLRAIARKTGLPQGLTIVRGFPGAEQLEFKKLSQDLQQCLRRILSKK